MSHSVIVKSCNESDKEFLYDDFSFFRIVLENFFSEDVDFSVKIDPSLVTLDQFIELIRLNPYTPSFKPDKEIKSSYDLDEWIDAISALSKIEDN